VAAFRPRMPNSAGVVVTVPGVVPQARGRPHKTNSGGDGVPPACCHGLTLQIHERSSRVCPAPLRGRGVLAIWEWAAQCHGADTGHTAQSPIVAGMGSP
jgi:hypothetical protein